MNITFNRIEQKNRAGCVRFLIIIYHRCPKVSDYHLRKCEKLLLFFFFEEIHCYIMPRLPSKSEYDVEQFEKKKKK